MLLDTVLSSGMFRDAERVLLNNRQVHGGGTRGEPTQTDTGRTRSLHTERNRTLVNTVLER